MSDCSLKGKIIDKKSRGTFETVWSKTVLPSNEFYRKQQSLEPIFHIETLLPRFLLRFVQLKLVIVYLEWLVLHAVNEIRANGSHLTCCVIVAFLVRFGLMLNNCQFLTLHN